MVVLEIKGTLGNGQVNLPREAWEDASALVRREGQMLGDMIVDARLERETARRSEQIAAVQDGAVDEDARETGDDDERPEPCLASFHC